MRSLLRPAGPSLDLVLELNGEWHGHEVEGGVKDANSGGNVIYLSPGLRISMDKWSAFASVGMLPWSIASMASRPSRTGVPLLTGVAVPAIIEPRLPRLLAVFLLLAVALAPPAALAHSHKKKGAGGRPPWTHPVSDKGGGTTCWCT